MMVWNLDGLDFIGMDFDGIDLDLDGLGLGLGTWMA
jgi:hypothetical protein